MNSMTGFGYAENEENGVHMTVDIKSLNTRYLDIIVSLPPSLAALEASIRSRVQAAFLRGRVEVAVRVKDVEDAFRVTVDRSAAEAWKTALTELSSLLDSNQSVTLDMLMSQDGVLKTERKAEMDTYRSLLTPLLDSALTQVATHRQSEGVQLEADIESQLQVIEQALAAVEQRAPEMRQEVENLLRSRFQEILGDESGEQRILGETAAWIAKTDINEEIVRLGVHIKAFREETASGGGVGKKLDFLAQEMGREINTIGSKSPRADISRKVVDMKDALEKVREQLRNVE